jgi:hypothetical protein
MSFLSGSNPILLCFAGASQALAYTLVAPIAVITILGALMVVLIDFAIFRLHQIIVGQPEPKRLWEF